MRWSTAKARKPSVHHNLIDDFIPSTLIDSDCLAYFSSSSFFFFSCARINIGRYIVTNGATKMHIQIAGFTCITPYMLTSEIDWI